MDLKKNEMGAFSTIGGVVLFEELSDTDIDDTDDDTDDNDSDKTKDDSSSGKGIITFDNIKDLTNNGISKLKLGDSFKVLGYYVTGDYGAANYECKYIWSQEKYPWAIDLGESSEPEYQLVYNTNGYPKIDSDTNDYMLKTDVSGNPMPVYESDGKTIKKKHYYAIITDTVVNYAMFGAKLDGKTDDYKAIYLAHMYQSSNYYTEPITGRKKYYIKVANNKGIIRKDNNTPISCCGDIDLSGSELLVQSSNAAWYGFYLWGDNEADYFTYEPLASTQGTYLRDNFVIETTGLLSSLRPNSVINVKETPYAVRDDSGYLYSVARHELLLYTSEGVLANPFMENWNAAGGTEIITPYSDYDAHEKKSQVVTSAFEISYTRIPTTHYYFTGCDVKLEMEANEYCSVLWCKCHNAHIKGFNFIPNADAMHNTVFKNTMIYLWGAYNVEVSDIVGFNAAGKKENGVNGGSGYVLRATNCLNINVHDVSVQGYWGATAMDCVKDVHITRVNINRLDIHNYFYNLYIDQCNLYNHAIQIGEGRGMCQVTNSNFYVNNLTGDSYPNAHMIEFNATYGRLFSGKLFIDNCNAFIKDADGDEFDVCKIDFSPEAVSILEEFKFPETTISNCHLYAYNPATYLVYFMIAGTRNCKTATTAPTNLKGYCKDTGNNNDGALVWKYIGRGFDWVDDGNTSNLKVVEGQIIRTYSSYQNDEGKTVFYNNHYFLVTSAGTLPTPTEDNKPTDYSGDEFTVDGSDVKIKYVEDAKWIANKLYSTGDIVFTESSNFMPVFCYKCIVSGTSNGYRPVHTSGTIIEGVDEYPTEQDSCWWMYYAPLSDFISATYTANMAVKEGEIIYAEGRLYKVMSSGNMGDTPPIGSDWDNTATSGTASIQFIGKTWSNKTWWQSGCYCISTAEDGVKSVYQLTKHSGITSGDSPIENVGRVVDGDIIWQNDDTLTATKGAWTAETQYYEGDVVTNNGHYYECVFDGRLEMPRQIVLSNISSNMTAGGDVFAFYNGGTDIPTKCNASGKWTVKIDNVEKYRFVTPKSGYYFGHEGNSAPTIIDTSSVDTGSGTTNTVDSALSADSENPVQNKVIYTKLQEIEETIKNSSGTTDTTVDNTLSADSENPVQNKAIYNEIQSLKKSIESIETTGSTTVVDTELSADSKNPVENKAIYAKLQELEKLIDNIETTGSATISIDTTLSSDSENPVQNKVIYTKLQELEKLIESSSGTSGTTTVVVDGTLSADSVNPVQNKAIYTRLQELENLIKTTDNTVVDTTLSASSENPVQNKAIYSEIQELKNSIANIDTVTVDSVLSSNSTNPVQNKAIYATLQELKTLIATTDNTVVDSALSDSSTNPVQNKVIYAKLQELEKLIGDGGSTESTVTYLKKTVTGTGTDVWMDSTIIDVPEEMTKLKITLTADGGSCEIGAVTDGNNWVTKDNITKVTNLSTDGRSVVFNVSSGQVRPIINYYGGSSSTGTLTVLYEGTSVINKTSATLTMPSYTK